MTCRNTFFVAVNGHKQFLASEEQTRRHKEITDELRRLDAEILLAEQRAKEARRVQSVTQPSPHSTMQRRRDMIGSEESFEAARRKESRHEFRVANEVRLDQIRMVETPDFVSCVDSSSARNSQPAALVSAKLISGSAGKAIATPKAGAPNASKSVLVSGSEPGSGPGSGPGQGSGSVSGSGLALGHSHGAGTESRASSSGAPRNLLGSSVTSSSSAQAPLKEEKYGGAAAAGSIAYSNQCRQRIIFETTGDKMVKIFELLDSDEEEGPKDLPQQTRHGTKRKTSDN